MRGNGVALLKGVQLRMVGASERQTGRGRKSRNTMAEMRADQTGSVALSTCVNEIAPRPKEMTPPTCVPARRGCRSGYDHGRCRAIVSRPFSVEP